VGAGRIPPLADMDTIWLAVAHHPMDNLSCDNPDFIEET